MCNHQEHMVTALTCSILPQLRNRAVHDTLRHYRPSRHHKTEITTRNGLEMGKPYGLGTDEFGCQTKTTQNTRGKKRLVQNFNTNHQEKKQKKSPNQNNYFW